METADHVTALNPTGRTRTRLAAVQTSVTRLTSQGWRLPEASADGVHYATATDGTPISYPDEGLDVLGLEGGSGFWFDHRAKAIGEYLDRLGASSIWEVGSGTGAVASRLRGRVPDIVAIEPLAAGAQAAARLGITSLCGTLQDFDLPDHGLECIGAFDVLEHLEDPDSLIAEFRRVLKPRGAVLVTVPAFQGLWGDEDDVAGHYRRYTKASLNAEFSRRGFTRIASQYLFASLVPPAAVMRALPYRLGRRREKREVLDRMTAQLDVSPTVNTVAAAVLDVEAAFARLLPLPVGLSLLGAFRAPG